MISFTYSQILYRKNGKSKTTVVTFTHSLLSFLVNKLNRAWLKNFSRHSKNIFRVWPNHIYIKIKMLLFGTACIVEILIGWSISLHCCKSVFHFQILGRDVKKVRRGGPSNSALQSEQALWYLPILGLRAGLSCWYIQGRWRGNLGQSFKSYRCIGRSS